MTHHTFQTLKRDLSLETGLETWEFSIPFSFIQSSFKMKNDLTESLLGLYPYPHRPSPRDVVEKSVEPLRHDGTFRVRLVMKRGQNAAAILLQEGKFVPVEVIQNISSDICP